MAIPIKYLHKYSMFSIETPIMTFFINLSQYKSHRSVFVFFIHLQCSYITNWCQYVFIKKLIKMKGSTVTLTVKIKYSLGDYISAPFDPLQANPINVVLRTDVQKYGTPASFWH